MSVKDKFVALEIGSDGTCEQVLECKTITNGEYKKLINEQKIAKQKKETRLANISFEIAKNGADIYLCQMFIAKSIYDNMVDRGYFQSDDIFEKAFYDYVFENKKIECEYPKEFKVILERVKGK